MPGARVSESSPSVRSAYTSHVDAATRSNAFPLFMRSIPHSKKLLFIRTTPPPPQKKKKKKLYTYITWWLDHCKAHHTRTHTHTQTLLILFACVFFVLIAFRKIILILNINLLVYMPVTRCVPFFIDLVIVMLITLILFSFFLPISLVLPT